MDKSKVASCSVMKSSASSIFNKGKSMPMKEKMPMKSMPAKKPMMQRKY